MHIVIILFFLTVKVFLQTITSLSYKQTLNNYCEWWHKNIN